MNYQQIIKELRNRIYKPFYFLCGDEPFFIDEISKYIEKHVLTDEQKAFNQIVLYGKSTDIETIVTTARRYPVMSPVQVVIVREAQNISKIEQLQIYMQAPMKTTVLVVCYKYKTPDKRTKFIKEIMKQGVFYKSKKLYDNQIPEWVYKQVHTYGYKINAKAAMMLRDFLGNDLSKIDNELQKLILNLNKEKTISPQLIERHIGISKDYNNFELQNALGLKNVVKVHQIVKHFGANPKNHPFVVTISVLFNFFSKVLTFHYLKDKRNNNSVASKLGIRPYFVGDYRIAASRYKPEKLLKIISLLREYDLKSKGVNSMNPKENELLKELVCKIMY